MYLERCLQISTRDSFVIYKQGGSVQYDSPSIENSIFHNFHKAEIKIVMYSIRQKLCVHSVGFLGLFVWSSQNSYARSLINFLSLSLYSTLITLKTFLKTKTQTRCFLAKQSFSAEEPQCITQGTVESGFRATF